MLSRQQAQALAYVTPAPYLVAPLTRSPLSLFVSVLYEPVVRVIRPLMIILCGQGFIPKA
ncbi:hypothetical protein H8F21_14395 [Pseudomonas sp. P66]|uniref:Uncharacterized protein n=1 Tax=Pseudomonas arcuscaelestis TaxID=2710591 RepID=A0ABS2BYT1_9PSED|nr:hypothetical protein [Pseudomonas arcuscaelestis]MBM5458754.1 hypothetical protein [Pseudomonas arcuscaelestis]